MIREELEAQLEELQKEALRLTQECEELHSELVTKEEDLAGVEIAIDEVQDKLDDLK